MSTEEMVYFPFLLPLSDTDVIATMFVFLTLNLGFGLSMLFGRRKMLASVEGVKVKESMAVCERQGMCCEIHAKIRSIL